MAAILYIDVNNLGYGRATARQKSYKMVDGFPYPIYVLSYLFKTVEQLVKELKKKHKKVEVAFCWDDKSYRYLKNTTNSSYKDSNKNQDKKKLAKADYVSIIHDVREVASTLGIKQYIAFGHEADDCFAALAEKHKGKKTEVFIVTNDRDPWLLIHDNISIIDPIDNLIVDSSNFAEKSGFKSPNHLLQGSWLFSLKASFKERYCSRAVASAIMSQVDDLSKAINDRLILDLQGLANDDILLSSELEERIRIVKPMLSVNSAGLRSCDLSQFPVKKDFQALLSLQSKFEEDFTTLWLMLNQ